MKRTKEQRRHLSQMMKKRWRVKKGQEQPTEVQTNDPILANAVNSSFSGVAIPVRQERIFIRINRPDGSVFTFEH